MTDKKLTRAELRAQMAAIAQQIDAQKDDDVVLVKAAIAKLLADNELEYADVGLQEVAGTTASKKFGSKTAGTKRPIKMVYDRPDGSIGAWGGGAATNQMKADGIYVDGKTDQSKMRVPTEADLKKLGK